MKIKISDGQNNVLDTMKFDQPTSKVKKGSVDEDKEVVKHMRHPSPFILDIDGNATMNSAEQAK